MFGDNSAGTASSFTTAGGGGTTSLTDIGIEDNVEFRPTDLAYDTSNTYDAGYYYDGTHPLYIGDTGATSTNFIDR